LNQRIKESSYLTIYQDAVKEKEKGDKIQRKCIQRRSGVVSQDVVEKESK